MCLSENSIQGTISGLEKSIPLIDDCVLWMKENQTKCVVEPPINRHWGGAGHKKTPQPFLIRITDIKILWGPLWGVHPQD